VQRRTITSYHVNTLVDQQWEIRNEHYRKGRLVSPMDGASMAWPSWATGVGQVNHVELDINTPLFMAKEILLAYGEIDTISNAMRGGLLSSFSVPAGGIECGSLQESRHKSVSLQHIGEGRAAVKGPSTLLVPGEAQGGCCSSTRSILACRSRDAVVFSCQPCEAPLPVGDAGNTGWMLRSKP
jgi:hypothetical protein